MITIVAPPLDGPVSGGTLFNRAIASAVGARVVDSLDATPDFAWVDTLFLDVAATRWSERPLGLLAHYLPSLVEHPTGLEPSMLSFEERAALDGARVIVCPSTWMADTLQRLGAKGELRVLEPPLPEGARVGPRPSGEPRLVMVGAVSPGKAQASLLEALAARPPVARWTLDIIGSTDVAPAYAETCRALACALPVRLLGPRPPDECLALVARSHGLVSASVMESYGMAIAEAQACGVPVLALERGNVGTLVRRPGSVGAPTAETLADAVREHLEHPEPLIEGARANPRVDAPGWRERALRAMGGLFR